MRIDKIKSKLSGRRKGKFDGDSIWGSERAASAATALAALVSEKFAGHFCAFAHLMRLEARACAPVALPVRL